MSARPIEIFYSYSREDRELCEQMNRHLGFLKRNNVITAYNQMEVEAGLETQEEVRLHLDRADIILLLLSADFIASDPCWDVLERALARQRAGSARAIGVLLRPCYLEGFKELEFLPSNGQPVKSWPDPDSALHNVALSLVEVINGMRGMPVIKTAAPAAAERDVIELPYLCDRVEQEDELYFALQRHNTELPRRPFVCVIHGDKDECPDKFKDRIQERWLPWFLELDPRRSLIQDRLLTFRSRRIPREQMKEMLRQFLADKFDCKRTASLTDIADAVGRFQAPVLVYSHLTTERWAEGGPELVETFIDFWNEFPDLPAGPRLIACLVLTHKTDTDERLKSKAEAIEYLGALDFNRFEKVSGAVLCELAPVPEDDVKNWAWDEKSFRDYCRSHTPKFCHEDNLIREIEAIYTGVDALPMARLAEKLASLLDRFTCKG